ncbi:MAG TPA: hypothetical protein VII99_03420 [Bacteroidia bacterium]
MSDEHNIFDDIIREKYSGKNFLFNEENWEKAERLIDKRSKFLKTGKWALVFLCGLLAGVGIMAPFIRDNHPHDTASVGSTSPVNSNKTELIAIGSQGNINNDNKTEMRTNSLRGNKLLESKAQTQPDVSADRSYKMDEMKKNVAHEMNETQTVKENVAVKNKLAKGIFHRRNS